MPAERRVRLVTGAILLAGAIAASVIFVANGSETDEFRLERSKKVAHDMEVYGGRANVLADDFREWFAGLWRGRNLAGTVAVLTVLTALVYRFIAAPLPRDEKSGPPTENPPS
jgi:hypothetical protein